MRKSKQMKNLGKLLVTFFVLSLLGSVLNYVHPVLAQSTEGWTDPVNLSNSGSSKDPLSVIDSEGRIHVVWVDAIDGYKYAMSTDGGETWTLPQKAVFPFSPKDNIQPTFIATPNGIIYILWRDEKNALYYAQTQSTVLANSSSWTKISKISDAVMNFNGVVDSRGDLYLGYVKNLGKENSPAGVYFNRIGGSGLTKPLNIYSSKYFRSLDATSAHVQIAVSDKENSSDVYMVWDDRPQKRIYIAKSIDGGLNWGKVYQIAGPENLSGIATPFNIDVDVEDNKVLLTWQLGQPGGICTEYSAWSLDGGEQFSQTVKVSDPFNLCSQASELIYKNDKISVALFNILDDISLAAWNGSTWSRLQSQNEIAAFVNPLTLDNVILGCQKTSVHANNLYIVGCDKGGGGDIWFSSRPLSSMGDWFPSSTRWSPPVEVVSIDQKISDLSSTTDGKDNVHTFWIQSPITGESGDKATIQYARWNGTDWSSPMVVISTPGGNPTQMNVMADDLGRLLVAWVNSDSGDILFSWANAENANRIAEWSTPQYIPTVSQANSSPSILADSSGRILVAYAVSINEQRGIYFVVSDDGGKSWTQPIRAFNAEAANWEMVDQPRILLTEDGRLHLLFEKYSLRGGERLSEGIYYSQSIDGGRTWSKPDAVSESPVSWSQLVSSDSSTIHRMWQEYKNSELISYDQVSKDGGMTWDRPVSLSSASTETSPVTQTFDIAGKLYFLQIIDDVRMSIKDYIWNGSAWNSGESEELYTQNHVAPSSIVANTTSTGNIIVLVAADHPDHSDKLRNDILSISKSLELPKDVQTPAIARIPMIEPAQIMTEVTPTELSSPPTEIPAADTNELQSFLLRNKNLIGILFISGIVLLTIVVFRPLPGKHKSRKKS
jgi:hypothetical protein